MRVSRSLFVAAAAGLALAAGTASAAPVLLSSTVPHNNFAGTTSGAPGTLLATYDFTGQIVNPLTSIDSIVITLAIGDGDTAAGEFDNGNLSLTLDGIATGLLLDGFSNNNIVTLTLLQPAAAIQAAIIAALADNTLVARIVDSDPADGNDPLNNITLSSLLDTTLEINAQDATGGGPGVIPLPAAVLVAPLGACLAGMYSRRFRRSK